MAIQTNQAELDKHRALGRVVAAIVIATFALLYLVIQEHKVQQQDLLNLCTKHKETGEVKPPQAVFMHGGSAVPKQNCVR